MDNEQQTIYSSEWKIEASKLLSKQISLEYQAFYYYTAASAHFDNPNVSLIGLSKFYKSAGLEEIGHAQMIIEFMNKQGLEIEFTSIPEPNILKSNDTPVQILLNSRQFEENVLTNILKIVKAAADVGDAAITEFFDKMIREQVDEVKRYNQLYVNCKRCSDSGTGLYLFDQSLLCEKMPYFLDNHQ